MTDLGILFHPFGKFLAPLLVLAHTANHTTVLSKKNKNENVEEEEEENGE